MAVDGRPERDDFHRFRVKNRLDSSHQERTAFSGLDGADEGLDSGMLQDERMDSGFLDVLFCHPAYTRLLRHQHQRKLVQISGSDFQTVGQPMIASDEQTQLIRGKRFRAQGVGPEHLFPGDCQVARAGPQGSQQVLFFILPHDDPGFGMRFLKIADGLEEPVLLKNGQRHELDLRNLLTGMQPGETETFLIRISNHLAVRLKASAENCQTDTATAPIEQQDAQFGFKRVNLLGNSRLCHVVQGSRFREAQCIGKGEKNPRLIRCHADLRVTGEENHLVHSILA